MLRARLALALTLLISWAAAQDFSLSRPEVRPLVPGKRWAVVVGVSNYTSFGKLLRPTQDAKAVAHKLKESFGFDEDSVQLITDAADSSMKPSPQTLRKSLDNLLANPLLDRSDLFVFYFAGHGVGTPSGDYLLASDATPENQEQAGLPVKEIIEKFSKAGLRNVLVVADACRSGKENNFGRELLKLAKDTNICVVLGCEPGKRSYEDLRLPNGVFTHFLLEELDEPSLMEESTGALWASVVGKKVQEDVKEYSERDHPEQPQTPQVWAWTTRDVLLKLDATKYISGAQLTRVPDRDTIVSSAIYAAEELHRNKRDAEAFRVMQSVEGFAAEDSKLGANYFLAARRVGLFGRADRMRSAVLRGGGTSLNVAGLVLSSGSWPTSTQQRVAALKQLAEALTHPEDQYNLLLTVLVCADLAPAFKDLLPKARKLDARPRWAFALDATELLFREEPARAIDVLLKAKAAAGSEPSSELLSSAALLAWIRSGLSALADKVAPLIRKESVFHGIFIELYLKAERFDEVGKTLDSYITAGMPYEDLLRVARVAVGRDEWLHKLLGALPKQSDDWRVQGLQAIVSASLDSPPQLDNLLADPTEGLYRVGPLFEVYRRVLQRRIAEGDWKATYKLRLLLRRQIKMLLESRFEVMPWLDVALWADECGGDLEVATALASKFDYSQPTAEDLTAAIPLFHELFLRTGLRQDADRLKERYPELRRYFLLNEGVLAFARHEDDQARGLLAEARLLGKASMSTWARQAPFIEAYLNPSSAGRPDKGGDWPETETFFKLLREAEHDGKLKTPLGVEALTGNTLLIPRFIKALSKVDPGAAEALSPMLTTLNVLLPTLASMDGYSGDRLNLTVETDFARFDNDDFYIDANLTLSLTNTGTLSGRVELDEGEVFDLSGTISASGLVTGTAKSGKRSLKIVGRLPQVVFPKLDDPKDRDLFAIHLYDGPVLLGVLYVPKPGWKAPPAAPEAISYNLTSP